MSVLGDDFRGLDSSFDLAVEWKRLKCVLVRLVVVELVKEDFRSDGRKTPQLKRRDAESAD
jgi:hypothetical protein